MSEFWDYNTKNKDLEGSWLVSGRGSHLNMFDAKGNLHRTYQYYDVDKGWIGECVIVEFPITTFCGWLHALKVGAIKADTQTPNVPRVILPSIRDIVIMGNARRMMEEIRS